MSISAPASAPAGVDTQDINNISAYTLQKPCARGCFQNYGICPADKLGSELGCVSAVACKDYGWQASNDCYCRPDFQNIAQQYLSSCVTKSCSLGNVGIDASSAGSIYSQYCSQKGYTAALPASAPATTTDSRGQAKTISGGVSGPTGSSDPGQNSSSSGSGGLSLAAIVGIAVGSLVGLILLVYLLRSFRRRSTNKPTYPQHPPQVAQEPVYPMNPYYSPRYPSPKFESELGPDDSASMLSGPVRPAPTLVSGMGNPQGRW